MKICAILLATVTLAQDEPPAASSTAPVANYQAPVDNYQAPSYKTPSYKTPLKCWHCDAMSFEECGYEGHEQICSVSSYYLV